MDGCDYIKLMRKTIDYFETQCPIFRKALKSLLDYTPFDGTDEMKQGIWLAGNLLQTNKENLSIDDINMGIEIADTIKKLASVVDAEEVAIF